MDELYSISIARCFPRLKSILCSRAQRKKERLKDKGVAFFSPLKISGIDIWINPRTEPSHDGSHDVSGSNAPQFRTFAPSKLGGGDGGRASRCVCVCVYVFNGDEYLFGVYPQLRST
jgi:hypothetical protein